MLKAGCGRSTYRIPVAPRREPRSAARSVFFPAGAFVLLHLFFERKSNMEQEAPKTKAPKPVLVQCPECKGAGFVRSARCRACKGSGRVEAK